MINIFIVLPKVQRLNLATKANLLRFFCFLVLLCLTVLLSACQEKTWVERELIHGNYTIKAQFPKQPTMVERPYQLLNYEAEAPLNMLQWFAADGENSFTLSSLLVPEGLDSAIVAKELLRSMTLKRDDRLNVAPTEFKQEFERGLPDIDEQFKVYVDLDSRSLVAIAKVLIVGQLVVQVYATGVVGDQNFLQQSEHFFNALKIGDTIN